MAPLTLSLTLTLLTPTPTLTFHPITQVALFMALSFCKIFHFYYHFARTAWEPHEPPDDPNDVGDPLYRVLSKIRTRICPRGRANTIMDRERGSFEKDEEELAEPMRTERLLSRPFGIFHDNGTDSIDSLSFLWLNRASMSYGAFGVFYAYIVMSAQVMISVISSAGSGIAPGTFAANLQLILILSLQLGTGFYCALLGPAADRWDGWMAAISYTLEGLGTLLLLLPTLFPGDLVLQDSCQTGAFMVALLSMFLPILEKVSSCRVCLQTDTLTMPDPQCQSLSCTFRCAACPDYT